MEWGRFRYKIKIKGQEIEGGPFDTCEEAAFAYDSYVRIHYPNGGYLNFPDGVLPKIKTTAEDLFHKDNINIQLIHDGSARDLRCILNINEDWREQFNRPLRDINLENIQECRNFLIKMFTEYR